jgi:hypothetical protein
MKLAYEHGLKKDVIPLCSTKDTCDHADQKCLKFHLFFDIIILLFEVEKNGNYKGLGVCGMRK